MSHPQGGPQAQAPVPPGMGRLIVDCSYTPMAFMLGATGPAVYVDGQQCGFMWGPTVVDLPPGQHHLHVHTRYMGQFGKADATVSIVPGRTVHMYYRAPLTVFNAGALGATPQSSPGVGATVALVVVPIAVVLFIVLIALLA